MEDSREQSPKGNAQRTSLITSLSIALRIAFSKPAFIAISVAVFVVFWIVFNLFDQTLFLSPIPAFYVAPDLIGSFVLSTVTAGFLGLVAGMNAFALTVMRASGKIGGGSLLSGTSIATLSTACAGCSSLGATLVATLGGTGIAATTLMSVYQTPLRLVALGVLAWALYSTSRKISGACAI